MTNPHRGEVKIHLAGRDFIMRPTFQALAEIEHLAGAGIVEIANRLIAKQYGVRDAAAIITPAIKAAGEVGANYERVGEMVVETGLTNIAPSLLQFVVNAISGGEPKKAGEAKAAETV